MLREIATLTVITTLFLPAGCDPEPASSSDVSLCDNSDVNSQADHYEPDTGPPSADLTGRWAMIQVLTATVNIAGAQASENRVTTLLVADIDAADGSVTMNEEVCNISLTNVAGVCGEGSLVTTVIPDAYIASIGVSERFGTVTDDNGTLTLDLPRVYQLKGVKLDDPSSDGMPTDPSDSAFWDQDGDGKPGMTLRFVQPGMLVGELYVGQRDWTEMTGTITGGGKVEGQIGWNSEQVTLGANPEGLLDSSPKSAPSNDAAKSYFQMVRIEETQDCAAVVADKTNLFPGH